MYAVIMRHGPNSPWQIHGTPIPSMEEARAHINKTVKYTIMSAEYRIAPLGDADTWHDPYAEQAAAEDRPFKLVAGLAGGYAEGFDPDKVYEFKRANDNRPPATYKLSDHSPLFNVAGLMYREVQP